MHKAFAGILTGVFFLIALPFVMLYEYLGPGLFWLVMICLAGICAAFWYWRKVNMSVAKGNVLPSGEQFAGVSQGDWNPRQPSEEKQRRERLLNEKRAELQREAQQIRERRWRAGERRQKRHFIEMPSEEGGIYLVINWPEQLKEIWAAWDDEDWEFVRTWLQKYAYALTDKGASEAEHADFKTLMVQFTQVDPLFRVLMETITPLITATPGVLQSVITKELRPQFKTDDIRYALYFAAEANQITRVKKGRSYQLYPAVG